MEKLVTQCNVIFPIPTRLVKVKGNHDTSQDRGTIVVPGMGICAAFLDDSLASF